MEVLIRVTSMQGCGTEDEDVLEFSTDGVYDYKNGIGRIMYYETEVTGLIGTRTKVIFTRAEVVVDRKGTITGRMVFKEGESNAFVYETPYGNATLSMNTIHIEQQFDERGGSMELDYIVNVEHTVVSRNKFRVTVEPIGE